MALKFNEKEVDQLDIIQSGKKEMRVSTARRPPVRGNSTIMNLLNSQLTSLQPQINYLNKMNVYSTFTIAGATIETGSISVITFPNVFTASDPSDLSMTDKNDFIVFCNGQYIEHDAITIEQSGSNFVINANTGSLGYVIDDFDEVLVWGRFES